ncbi:MAG: ABC transporter ATP-binding protein [Tissierellia bacterium]|nr:ABC transporter ATP-binding protein [Tissierellia bacterium]
MSYVEFKEVRKSYTMGQTHIVANDGVNFSIEQGEFAVILGPSGAGKSTILNILGGMDTCDEGEVLVDGVNIAAFGDRERTQYRRDDVGFVFQFYNLIPNLTALENVELSSSIVKEALDPQSMLEEVGLKDRINNFPAQLSGGEQQRVAIARALAKNPKLLLCDEPTGALDSQTGRKVLGVLDENRKTHKKTLILITHNRAIAPAADRVIEVYDGKVRSERVNPSPLSLDEIEW